MKYLVKIIAYILVAAYFIRTRYKFWKYRRYNHILFYGNSSVFRMKDKKILHCIAEEREAISYQTTGREVAAQPSGLFGLGAAQTVSLAMYGQQAAIAAAQSQAMAGMAQQQRAEYERSLAQRQVNRAYNFDVLYGGQNINQLYYK